jgi:hypothetical protein
MKLLKPAHLTLIIILLSLSSCSVQKRVYMPGYYIERNGSKNNSDEQKPTNNDKTTQIELHKTSNNEQKENEINMFSNMAMADNAIVSLTHTPVLSDKNKNSITVITKTPAPVAAKKSMQKNNVKKKKGKNNSALRGEKSQLIALLLCIFLGLLGIHRFYLGYPGIGILMILTAGGCGLLYIIDIVRIATGDLEPKDDSYDKAFDDGKY